MFDSIIIGMGSVGGTEAYYLAKRDNNGNRNIPTTKGTPDPW